MTIVLQDFFGVSFGNRTPIIKVKAISAIPERIRWGFQRVLEMWVLFVLSLKVFENFLIYLKKCKCHQLFQNIG